MKRRSFLGTLAALVVARHLPMDEFSVVPNGGDIAVRVDGSNVVDFDRDTIRVALIRDEET